MLKDLPQKPTENLHTLLILIIVIFLLLTLQYIPYLAFVYNHVSLEMNHKPL